MFIFLKKNWGIKDCEKIELKHVLSYLDTKIDANLSKQYLQKIVSAIGALETALNIYSKTISTQKSEYDFSISHVLLKEAVSENMIEDNYRNRTYQDPIKVIMKLKEPAHQIAALIELQSGTRLSACTLIKKEQLKGIEYDEISKTKKGSIITKEKGGKEGLVFVNLDVYEMIELDILEFGVFKINRQNYLKDIRETCISLGIKPEGSHSFRWSFAQNRMFECAKANYTYEESLLSVSKIMKHNRAKISTHYFGH